MTNEFYVDSQRLSEAALKKKHQLEQDPSSRTDHMAYLPDMEKIDSDVMDKVMAHMNSYDASSYTAKDVRRALQSDHCTIEDFKALISPAAEPFLEEMAQKARLETRKHFGNTVYLFTPIYIANYCENYCVYCGFNCYNDIHRMQLTMEQIEHEMKVIADSGMEEILMLTGEARVKTNIQYIGEACKLAHQMKGFVLHMVVGFLKHGDIVRPAFMKILIFFRIDGVNLQAYITEILVGQLAGLADVLDVGLDPGLTG